MVDELGSGGSSENADLTTLKGKVTAFFKAAMDEEAVEKKGAKVVLEPILAATTPEEIQKDVTNVFGKVFVKYAVKGPFEVGEAPDKKDSG